MMKICDHCQMIHETNHKTCIVCGRLLKQKEYEDHIEKIGYPEVSAVKKKRVIAARIFGITSIAISVIVAVINFMTWQENPIPWSLIIIGIFSYAWLLVSQVIISKHDYTTKTLRQVLIIAVILIIADLVTGYHAWALTYAIPFLLVGTTAFLPIVVTSMPKTYFLHVRSLFLLIIIDIVVLIIPFVSNWMEVGVTWTAAMTGISGFILLAAMWVFAPKTTYQELVKIFRI